jgi:hypothetical protein
MLFRTKRSPWRMSGLTSYPLGWVTWRSNGSLLEDHFYLHKGKVVHFSKIKRVTFRLTNILQECLEYVREGDTLVITRLDRLARSTLHLCQIAAELQRKQVNLKVIDQNINTSDATGRLLFNMGIFAHPPEKVYFKIIHFLLTGKNYFH